MEFCLLIHIANKKTASQKGAVFDFYKEKLILRNKGLRVQKQFRNHC